MSELDLYRAAVQDYAENGVDYLFHNRGDDHALIILTNIFKNAKETIRIAANRLYNDEVVNTLEYIDSMKSFLDKKNARLSILINSKPTKDEVTKHGTENTLYYMLFNHIAYRQGRVKIKEGNGKFFHNKNGDLINFCTGDSQMFRLEENIKERQATANFNDPNKTKQLIQIFDNVFPTLNSVVDLKGYFSC